MQFHLTRQFHVDALRAQHEYGALGRPSGRDIAAISNKYIAANASHGILHKMNSNKRKKSATATNRNRQVRLIAGPAYSNRSASN
jgi:hypothetical protein